MNWYYTIQGGHTHVRVFMNGGKCGDLVFRNEEFVAIRRALEYANLKMIPDKRLTEPVSLITFFNQTPSQSDPV
jgi:hypothetical protein